MLKSVMAHRFSQAPTVEVPRSRFDRSFGYKTTFDAGYLVPFYIDEALPGDTFDVDSTLFIRMLSALQVPVMDNIFIQTFFFKVPMRLVWNNFEKFMGAQDNPEDSTDYLIPQVNSGESGFATHSLFDYCGLPTSVSNLSVNALPFRAINLIYNQWFRDENLQESLPVAMDDGPDPIGNYNLFRRGKRHDYFTSALPWPQKGPAVDLPLGTTAPVAVYGDGNGLALTSNGTTIGNISWYSNYNSSHTLGVSNQGTVAVGASARGNVSNGSADTAFGVPTQSQLPSGKTSGLVGIADLSQATSATINSLRQAFQLQKYYEKDARGGTRYIEKILAHFGVKSPDARLQRAEYLGGSLERLNIYQVAQTSASTSDSAMADLSAYAVSASHGNGFVTSFTEHCYVIGFVNVFADLTYQQGIDRMWSRKSIVDFYWPSFAHLGEQPIYNKEIYAQGNATDDEVFGYQERYAEYRYKPSKITGKLRSSDPQSLDVYHLSQQFTSLPALNADFIQDNPPMKRVEAVQDEPDFVMDCYCKNICIRPMPVYSVPGLVDHF